MSGQSNVDDKMVAAVANARAPIRKSAPVIRRRVGPLSSVATVCRLPRASHDGTPIHSVMSPTLAARDSHERTSNSGLLIRAPGNTLRDVSPTCGVRAGSVAR